MGAILLKDISVDGQQKDILIRKGLIDKIGPAGACASWELFGDIEIMDCSRKHAVPGFVNMHTHSPMTLMRGLGEDIAFHEWLRRIWDVEARIDREYVYWASMVACLEMIKTGTTTFNDHYWHFTSSIQAASDMGLRIATGYDLMDKGNKEESERQMRQCEEKSAGFLEGGHGTLTYQLAAHAIYSVSEEMLLWAKEFTQKHGIKLHIHLSETEKEVTDCRKAHGGLSPVQYLESLGMLSPNLIAAHTLWVDDKDIELLGSRGVHCVHNINSNTKLASGYRFRYNELRDAGANICLGTDGCASSNNLDMLEAMKTAALFQKSWRNDPSAMPLQELMDMATLNGARALGFNGGRIAEGAVADICIVDTDNTFFLSGGSFLANFVYSAHSDCIDSVICNGRFLMRKREVAGEKEILAEARKVLSKLA